MGNPKHHFGGTPQIPDLDLPVPSAPPASRPNVSAAPAPSGAEKKVPSLAPGALADLGGDFGGEIERGPAVSAPPASRSSGRAGYPNVAIDMSPSSMGGGAFGDDFGMEIERGGGLSAPPAISSRSPAAGVHSAPPLSRPSGGGSGLDVAYQRSDLQRRARVADAPGVGERILAGVLSLVICVGVAGALFKFVHRAGRSVIGLLPHAFDASSTVQSGVVAGSLLVLAIAVGFIGVKAHPRSYAMIGSAATLLIASLAMVTVTLVSTEQNPMPPDGALLIPFALPAAVALLGLGIAWRGVPLFLRGGARRVLTLLVATIGGGLLFAAIEFSALASRIPLF